MRIGIIGAGHIGGTLARELTELGDLVRVANSRGPASLASLANETGARAVAVEDAVRDVELVIVTIPEKSVAELPKGLFDRVPKDVIVVDTGNYYPSWRDGHIEAIERGTTESGWVSSMLGRPVVKVFNNITAQSLAEGARPKGSRVRIALPVAGNDARAKIGAEHRVRTGDLRPWQGEALCPHGRSVSLLIHAMTAARSAACSGMPSNLARLSRCFHTFTGNRTERGIVGPVSVPFLGLPRPT